MNRRRILVMLLPVFAFATVISDTDFAVAAPKPPLTVAIAVPARGLREAGKPVYRSIRLVNEKSHFHVVVTNTSGKPQRLWETWNSWGYYNLRFEVADQKGKVLYEIKKKPRAWTVNFPSWIELAAGEQFVMDVYFDRESWKMPFLKQKKKGAFPLRMRAIFENKADEETKEHKIWTGRIASPLRNYSVGYWR